MKQIRDPFGVLAFLHWNHAWNNFHFREEILLRALRQLQDLGIGFVRVDILWSDLHQGSYQYDFSRYDHLIPLVRQFGLNILAVLQYNKVDRVDGKETWNLPPDDFQEFAAYVGATVNRYRNHIHHWEIWNEPNMELYWSAPKDQLASYTRLLSLAYQAAKKSDPSCVVMNGGLTQPIIEDLENLYQQGGKDLSDIINIHIFLDPLNPQSPDQFKQLVRKVIDIADRNGDQKKKIWITEMGCPGLPPHKNHLPWFGGPPVDEATQAKWIETQYRLIQDFPRVEKLFWAFYRDTENEFKDGTDYLGLVRHDLSPKPAYVRLKTLIHDWKEKSHKK